jgi:hypothetical protein
VPAELKLTDEQIKKIRRRVRAGARLIDLADEFGVNRKTLWRRLSALERDETERAQRTAANRLRRQAAREKRKLLERERAAGLFRSVEHNTPSGRSPGQGAPVRNPYHEWLDRRKNLSGRALSEAAGLVRVRNSGGTIRKWVERPEVDALLEAGWLLDE